MLEQQNNKQKLQILKALHIRMKQPKLNRINFESSTNVLKCISLPRLFIVHALKINAITKHVYT